MSTYFDSREEERALIEHFFEPGGIYIKNPPDISVVVEAFDKKLEEARALGNIDHANLLLGAMQKANKEHEKKVKEAEKHRLLIYARIVQISEWEHDDELWIKWLIDEKVVLEKYRNIMSPMNIYAQVA